MQLKLWSLELTTEFPHDFSLYILVEKSRSHWGLNKKRGRNSKENTVVAGKKPGIAEGYDACYGIKEFVSGI